MCSDDAATLVGERRRRQRRRSLLGGKIVLENDVIYDCVIRDISGTGALVRLSHPTPVPVAFRLVDLSRGVAFSATVAWRDLNSLGLRLTQPVDLAKSGAPAGLRRLWR